MLLLLAGGDAAVGEECEPGDEAGGEDHRDRRVVEHVEPGQPPFRLG